jgi:hypothetical protein
MQDQWGNTITYVVSGTEYVFTRTVDGISISYPTSLGLTQAQSLAVAAYNGMAPASVTLPVTPDPVTFVLAVLSSNIAVEAKYAIATQESNLVAAVSAANWAVVTIMWQLVISQASVSSADQATVAALAAQYGIQGISA